jgi:PAS domain S-box-containing protein
MPDFLLNKNNQLPFLNEKTMNKLNATCAHNATIVLDKEGVILFFNDKASVLFPVIDFDYNFYSIPNIAENSAFKNIIHTRFYKYSFPFKLDNECYNIEIERIADGGDVCFLCVFYSSRRHEEQNVLDEIAQLLLLPSPVLAFSEQYELEVFNKLSFDFFAEKVPFEIGLKLEHIYPSIYKLITNSPSTKKLFKDKVVNICGLNYLFSFQVITTSRNKKIIQFIEIEEVNGFLNEMPLDKKNKAIIEANPDLFFIISQKAEILDVVFSSEKELFYQPEYFLNKKLTEVLPADIWEISLQCLDRLFKTSENQMFKYQFPVGGSLKYYEARLVLFDHDKALSIIRDITEKEVAEIALKHERNLMQMLLDYSPVRIFFKDKQSRFVRVNKAMLASFGLKSEEEIIGKTDIDFFTSEYAFQTFEHEQEVMNSGNPLLNFDEKELRKDDSITWAINSKLPLYDGEKNIIGTFGVSLDITERKKIEEELRMSEERYRLFIEHSSDILVYLDENGLQKYISTSAERITGYSVDELKRSFTEVIHADDVAFVLSGFKQLLAEPNQIIKGEYRHKCKDGSYRYMETIGRNYINHPSVRGIVSNVRDITDRKLTEIALHKQNEEYEILNETLNENNLTIASINSALMETIEALAKSEQKLKEQNEEYQALNEDLLESNRCIELINSDLQKAKEKAEESDRLKSDFLANMSHEIRTPMNGLIGFSQMLADPELVNDKRMFYAKIIEQSCNQLLAIINDIIDISKIESKQIKVNREHINVRAVLDKYYTFFEPSCRNKKLQFEITDYPEPQNEVVYTDEVKLNQILTNLIGNALKFTTDGSIVFGCKEKNKFLEFYVKDTGIGIETANFSVIFDRFRQIETGMARNFGGTGLGLAISKAFVQLLGGEIWIESVVNEGSTFYFTIPIDVDYEKNKL